MSKAIVQTIGGAYLAAVGTGLIIATAGGMANVGMLLIEAGAGLIMHGVGTMLGGKGGMSGFATTTRNPVEPWQVVYGRSRVGGTITHLSEVGAE